MINVLSMIQRELTKKHMTPAELSRKLNLHQSTVRGMLRRNTLHVQKLADLSEVLHYNFFREIAERLPYEEPVFDNTFKQKEAALTEEISKLKEENKILKIKIEVFEQVIYMIRMIIQFNVFSFF